MLWLIPHVYWGTNKILLNKIGYVRVLYLFGKIIDISVSISTLLPLSMSVSAYLPRYKYR